MPSEDAGDREKLIEEIKALSKRIEGTQFEPHRPIFTPHVAPHLDGFALITPHATYVLTKGQLHSIIGKAGQLLFPPPFLD